MNGVQSVGGPSSVDWGGWLRHRVPREEEGVLPNDADTAHGAGGFVFDKDSFVRVARLTFQTR